MCVPSSTTKNKHIWIEEKDKIIQAIDFQYEW